MRGLLQAWAWRGTDTILHSLPLHHTHGIINALYCAHAAGATVHFMSKFSPAAVWATITVRGLALNLLLCLDAPGSDTQRTSRCCLCLVRSGCLACKHAMCPCSGSTFVHAGMT